ncbi:MAG: FtsX-like permease family protein [Bacteroidales bacterium]|jgi:ABC-type lipoprotein release transport system permease subunit|nr:FtsX-like permease family protein [Bacteroidales bacterium]
MYNNVLALFIAKKYFFSKKSHSAIHFISMVSVGGVAVATMALVCTLSIFNGFQQLISTLYSQIDPQLKIYPAKGKVFDAANDSIQAIKSWEEIALFSETIEENGLIRYGDNQEVGKIKAVDEAFVEMPELDNILYEGKLKLSDSIADYATLGLGLAVKLGIRSNFTLPVEIDVPNRKASINSMNYASSFTAGYAFVTGIFAISQPQYDDHYILLPLSFVRTLLDYETEVSAIELHIKSSYSIEKTKAKLKAYLGNAYLIKNQEEQQEDAYRIVQSEKWMAFFILFFILLIATFNMIGSLSMLIIDKKPDVKTLHSLGANNKLIFKIFLFEGWIIAFIGVIIGIVLGVLLCFIQEYFGILKLGDGSDAYIIKTYPVELQLTDIFLVFVIVLLIGLLTAWIPARSAARCSPLSAEQ